jgi:hypothetical protein
MHILNANDQESFDTAGVAQKHSLALKYLTAPNMDIKAFKGTLRLRVLYFAATLLFTINSTLTLTPLIPCLHLPCTP